MSRSLIWNELPPHHRPQCKFITASDVREHRRILTTEQAIAHAKQEECGVLQPELPPKDGSPYVGVDYWSNQDW